ncbi:hypothetical protein [Lelliottia sp. WAP21]|uniref:hypothetical protein n=1 Tax=Lelliottia sp. WAP21 TaxID=2877426 RepID=UPI001E4ED7E1|nr:hypothetical protein [Lelliottia sp. WAP21]
MSFRLTRSTSVDSAAPRPDMVNTHFSELVSKLRSVNTAPAIKLAETANATPKFESLKYRNQYRESVATNVMSALSKDFKLAYESGDSAQKRNLENVATAIYLTKIHLSNGDRDDSIFEKLIGNWLHAIKQGNQKPGSHFTAEQNFSVNRKNKERDAYQKAVNELGVFFKDNFSGPKALAKVVMEDVTQRCGDILKHYGVDISTIPNYLQQAAFNAERNMCQALSSRTSPGREGTAFLKQATLHINSMLNYPNYLRDILSRADTPAEQQPTSSVPPEENAALNEPENSAADPSGSFMPSGTTPVVTLSNIGNPVVNIDLGSRFDRLADNLEKLIENGNKVYPFHSSPLCHCQHVCGSSSSPHNASFLGKVITHRTQNAAAVPGSEEQQETPIAPSAQAAREAISPDGSFDMPDGRTVSEAFAENVLTGDRVDGPISIPSEIFGHNVADGPEGSDSDAQNDAPMQEDQAVAASVRPMHHIDTFMAKQERAGNFVTLSQSGLLRSNFIGSSSASMTRQTSQSMLSVDRSNDELLASSVTAPTEDDEKIQTFVSTASVTFHHRNKALAFDNESSIRQPIRHTSVSLSGSNETQASEGLGNKDLNETVSVMDDRSEPGKVRELIAFYNQNASKTAVLREEIAPLKAEDNSAADKTPVKNMTDRKYAHERPYSPYLDNKGNTKSPVTLTVDGLHRPKY